MLEAWRWLTDQECSSDQIVMRMCPRTVHATEQTLATGPWAARHRNGRL